MVKKVFLGVGHGGKDAGAVSKSIKEKDLNLGIALACKEVLKRHGVSVAMSRTKDENDPLSEEIKECNAFSPDLAVDIHNNAGGGDGAECFYHFGGGLGKVLASNILKEIVAIGQNSRGIKTKKNLAGKDYYGFIRQIKAPAVIVECAFVDKADDVAIIKTAEGQKKMGEAIAKGILKTFGIKWKDDKTDANSPNKSQSKTLYCVQVGAYSEQKNAEEMSRKLEALGFKTLIVTQNF